MPGPPANRIAAEIEACGHPVIPDSEAREWQSIDGIAGSFRRVAAELKESAPLATEADADRAYRSSTTSGPERSG